MFDKICKTFKFLFLCITPYKNRLHDIHNFALQQIKTFFDLVCRYVENLLNEQIEVKYSIFVQFVKVNDEKCDNCFSSVTQKNWKWC
jgi:hypothetical protein